MMQDVQDLDTGAVAWLALAESWPHGLNISIVWYCADCGRRGHDHKDQCDCWCTRRYNRWDDVILLTGTDAAIGAHQRPVGPVEPCGGRLIT